MKQFFSKPWAPFVIGAVIIALVAVVVIKVSAKAEVVEGEEVKPEE